MFKEELKKLRLRAFFTQKELCNRANIPLGTYKGWELGLQLPSPKNWAKYISFMESTPVRYDLRKIEDLYIKEKNNNDITD